MSSRPLTPEGWAFNEEYLFGTDLFNAGYFWEAHAFWERLWAAKGTAPEIRRFLRALIQTAAACLKARQGRAGARKLLDRARLERFAAGMLGVDVEALSRDARRFTEGEGEPPRIILALGRGE